MDTCYTSPVEWLSPKEAGIACVHLAFKPFSEFVIIKVNEETKIRKKKKS